MTEILIFLIFFYLNKRYKSDQGVIEKLSLLDYFSLTVIKKTLLHVLRIKINNLFPFDLNKIMITSLTARRSSRELGHPNPLITFTCMAIPS